MTEGPRVQEARPSGVVGQVFAVRDLDTTIAAFERLGLVMSDRAARQGWAIDTATFGFADGTYLELVTPTDSDAVVGATVASFLERRGDGPYMVTFETDDVHRYHDLAVQAGIGVVSPPQAIPDSGQPVAHALWLKPRSTAGAFVQLIEWTSGRPAHRRVAGMVDGLFTEVLAVEDMSGAVGQFEALGLDVWSTYRTELWGLETAVLRLPDGTNLEIVSPADPSRPAAAAVDRQIGQKGRGHYMTVMRCPDVDALHRHLESAGVATLGPPAVAPPQSPWGPCAQIWPHPGALGGLFLEFLTLPETAREAVSS